MVLVLFPTHDPNSQTMLTFKKRGCHKVPYQGIRVFEKKDYDINLYADSV